MPFTCPFWIPALIELHEVAMVVFHGNGYEMVSPVSLLNDVQTSTVASWLWRTMAKVEAFATFFMVLYLARMRREGKNKLWWVSSKRGLFRVKSFKKNFYSVISCHDGFCFPCKSFWRTKVPLRVAFFGWSVAIEKIFVRLQGKKDGLATKSAENTILVLPPKQKNKILAPSLVTNML
jgi:hypothetical protein